MKRSKSSQTQILKALNEAEARPAAEVAECVNEIETPGFVCRLIL